MACSVIRKRAFCILLTIVGISSLTIVYEHRYSIHDVHVAQINGVKTSSEVDVRSVKLEGGSSSPNSTNNTAERYLRPLHRLPSKDEIYRKVSELWQNVMELNEARIRELRRQIEENPGKFSSLDLRLFLRTVVNETAVEEIRKTVSKTVSRCQAMQIVRPDVLDNSIILESDLGKVTKRNQSDCVPVYDSCAIVGNSGILLDSGCGDVIDSADFVIRNNMAAVEKRFERDVGMRVDAMSINLELIYALTICTKTHKGGKLPPRTTCDALMEKMKMFQEGRIFWFFKRYTKLFKEMNAMFTALRKKNNLDFRLGYSPVIPMDTAKSLAKVPVPSSGLAVYVAATQFCKSVNLFGFYPFNDRGTDNDTVMAHYYDDKVYHFSKNHKIPKEYAWLVELNKRGALRLINDCTSL